MFYKKIARLRVGPFMLQGLFWAIFMLCSTNLHAIDSDVEIPFEEIEIDLYLSNPHCKAMGDINGDGYVDLVVGGTLNVSGVVWYEYIDQDTWQRHVINSSDNFTTSAATGDVDADGDLDIIIPSGLHKGDHVWWFENPRPAGDPAIDNWVRHDVGPAGSHDVRVGDLDRDNKLDIVAQNGPLILFHQNSPDSWNKIVIEPSAGEGTAIGDLDGDGDLDIAIGGAWYETPVDPVNQPFAKHTYAGDISSTGEWAVHIDDINQDGRNDIMVCPSDPVGNRELRLYLAPADPKNDTWTEVTVFTNTDGRMHSLDSGDIDDDGDIDIVTAEMEQTSQKRVVVARNSGDSLSWDIQVVANIGSHDLHTGDVDDDNDMDLFGVNHGNNGGDVTVYVWRNLIVENGLAESALDKWQRHEVDSSRPWKSIFITSADIDKDGFNDIVTGGWWYENPGSASGAWARHTIGSPLNNMAAVYDFDSDGDLDVLGTEGQGSGSNSSFSWAQNDGSGSFTVLSNVSNGDGDFLQGVAVDSFSSGTRSVALSWHIAGKGIQLLDVPSDPVNTTWQWQQISNISQNEDLSSGDIDGDGDMDLLLGTRWLQNNNGDWSEFTVNGVSGNPDRNELADINGDGRLDAVVGFEAISTSGKLAWYEQPSSATGTWAERVIANVIGPMSVDVADMDHDGDPDVVVGEHNLANPSSARVYVFENTGGGAGWNQHTVYTGDEHHDGTQLVDIDNDGDLDIISIGWSHGRVVLYENRAIISGMPTVATPLITPNGGVYSGPVQVAMSTSTNDAKIRYTTDGSNPTMSATLYTEPFALSQTTTIKARGFKSGNTDSTIRTATFTITIDTQAPSLISVYLILLLQ